MKPENQKTAINTFGTGINRDSDIEITGANPGQTGEYLASRNGRPSSVDGNAGAHERIKGEEIIYPSTHSAPSDFQCIGSASVNGSLLEFWADTNAVRSSFVRVDGVVVLESALFDYKANENFQLDKNERCIGGEVFITNFRTPPMILNVKDMVDSLVSNPQKYFSAFNPRLYQVNAFTPPDSIAFIELVNVGGGGGLPVGKYTYAMRYVSDSGDRTNWTIDTFPIPIVQSFNSESRAYPYSKTYGGTPDPSSKTSYAIKLRFRVNNDFNYQYIEIKRVSLNQGAGIGYAPESVLVAKIPISNGEISVRDYLDPAESNENVVVDDAQDTQQIAFIDAAKTVRYFDRRLVFMNVKIASKESNLTFEQINGKVGFETIQKLGVEGYKDPYNQTYKTSYARGEKHGFGVELFDGVFGQGFVTPIPTLENFQMPNRRDPMGVDEDAYSYDGTVTAADVNNNITQTHEVFDHYTGVQKTDGCSFKNIIRSGSTLGLTGTKTVSTVNEDCTENDGQIESHGAKITGTNVSVTYQPFTPVRANDQDVTGLNYIVNTQVSVNSGTSAPDSYDYRPNAFAPVYYAQGMLLAGVSNFPDWAKSFSIVRRSSAQRIIAQGLGVYTLQQGDYQFLTNKSLCTKEANKLWLFCPDIENGVVSSDVVNDIISNPQNYKVQLVSPLGFFSEVYNFENVSVPAQRDKIVDMISYARVLRDEIAVPKINPGEDPNMGINGGDGNNYIGFAKWRNTGGGTPQTPPTFSGPSAGNTEFNISQVSRKAMGRGTYLEIEFPTNIYGAISTGGTFNNNFDEDGMKAWTEPVYMVNIISSGANISDNNIDGYKTTGFYQKLESVIGQGNGLPGQKFILVDERWEDSIPHYNQLSPFASTPRYIYIVDSLGNEKKWLNVTFLSTTDISLINATITSSGSYTGPFGVGVQGMYTHEIVDSNGNVSNDGKNRFFNIVFNVLSYFPLSSEKIVIKYDNTAPIRFFGGDTVIGESLFAPIDLESDADDNVAENQFAFGIGFPYRHWKVNPRYYQIKRTSGVNLIQDQEWGYLGFLRQLCFMFTVESKIAVHYAYNVSYPLEFFPLINYVIRPHRWDEDKTIIEQGIYQDYVDDYGEDEKSRWKWGGFRFTQNVNPDYSNEPPIKFFSKPDFGFAEQTEFCTRIMWSLPRAINVQDSPGLKTFPANNSFDIDDSQGEIKFAFDATSGRGQNLYAFCEKGICLLVTNKSILSDLDAGELAYMAADSFIREQYWLSRQIGMNDEMWRSAAESFMPVNAESGSETRYEGLIFANKESVFRFLDNSITDIGRIKYYSFLYSQFLSKILPGFNSKVCSVFDEYFQEYWLSVDNGRNEPSLNDLVVFSQRKGRWLDRYDYRFQEFCTIGNRTFGMRNDETYELNKGHIINGFPINYELTGCASPEQFLDKEFIRFRINTKDQSQKPTEIRFYKDLDGVMQVNILGANLKNYRGWEQYIGRILVSVDPANPRFQGRVIVFKIVYNGPGDFKTIDTGVQYKVLKGQ